MKRDQSFFHFIDDEELSERAYAYLFTLCDRTQYLFDCPYGEADFAIEAIGTECEGMIGALERQRAGSSWGMHGAILSFRLTEEVKHAIERASLDGVLPVWDRRLENLVLYKEGKKLYSTCSHEGYTDIDDRFLKYVSKFCERELPKTPLWKALEERYARISSRPTARLWKELDMLGDLDRQVSEAWQKYIRQQPCYEMSFETYLRIAHEYLGRDICERLERAGSYRQLHPEGYARLPREFSAFPEQSPFHLSDLWYDIGRELKFWKAFLPLHRRPCPPDKEVRSPTIIINQKRDP